MTPQYSQSTKFLILDNQGDTIACIYYSLASGRKGGNAESLTSQVSQKPFKNSEHNTQPSQTSYSFIYIFI